MLKTVFGFVCVVFASLATPAHSQSSGSGIEGLESGESSLLVGSAHPALFPELEVEGYDYLEASVSVEDKAASVTWAPFLFQREYSWLSETRLKLGQADGITSLGLSFKYDPLNPRSKNGIQVLKNLNLGSDDPLGLNSAKSLRIQRVHDQIHSELTKLADGSCSIGLSDIEELRMETVEESSNPAEGELLYKIHCGLRVLQPEIERLTGEIENEPNAAKRALLAKQLAPYSKANSIFLIASERSHIAEHLDSKELSPVARMRSESNALSKEIENSQSKWASEAYTGYREQLYSSTKPVLSLSYSSSFFKVLSGGETDGDGDDLNDNEHRTKARTLALSANWRISDRSGISMLLSRSQERASAEEGSPSADYDGFGLTWAHRITVLNKDGYKKSKDYKESLFVPSIIFGVAFEQKECDSSMEDCANGVLRSRTLTPFVDFKIRKAAQFRIGVPLRRETVFRAGNEGEEDSLDLVSLVAFQLGAPK